MLGTIIGAIIIGAIAGALSSLLTAKLADGSGEDLAEMAPEIVELLLTPFAGRRRAVAEARKEQGGQGRPG